MDPDQLYTKYQDLQRYVGWTEADTRRVASVGPLLAEGLGALVEDFYEEIDRHPGARMVIKGGAEQVRRLKGTLLAWLRELLSGQYDPDYVTRRWRVGLRHVEIGLEQVYTNVALSRLRTGLARLLEERWTGPPEELWAITRSLHKLLDLDLAIIEHAYQEEYMLRLQRTERLATIGQVSAGVAHELRNPLNVIKTSVYFLEHARNPTPEKRAEHLQRIGRHVDLADSVITALSRFAKLPLPEQRPCSLERCLRDTLEANPVPDWVQVTLEISAEVPRILVDQDQMRIVFGNLIRNACDAMPRGGTLRIVGRVTSEGVAVEFVDSGTGIPPEVMARIMEPLFSTKARGLGLGLAIARAIVDKNGGSLQVASTPGQGSTFRVHLQAAPC